jgi:hypothetical protein
VRLRNPTRRETANLSSREALTMMNGCNARRWKKPLFGTGLLLLAAAFVLIGGLGSSEANEVLNGSFEDPVIGPPFTSFTTPTSWTHTGTAGDARMWRIGYVDGGGSIIVAGEGSQFVTLGGGAFAVGTTTWSQIIPALAPGDYDLEFKMASEGPCCGTQAITVSFPAGSDTLPETFSADPAPATANYWRDWEQKAMIVHATGGDLTLAFTATVPFDVGLDDVNLEARPTQGVPVPGTLVLMSAGIAALVGASVRARGRH